MLAFEIQKTFKNIFDKYNLLFAILVSFRGKKRKEKKLTKFNRPNLKQH